MEFKEMSRKSAHNNVLDAETIENILKTEHYGVLTTLSEHGYPMSVPINIIYYEGKVYMHSSNQGEKYENIVRNPKVSLLVGRKQDPENKSPLGMYETVLIYGNAALLHPKDEEANNALKHMAMQFKQPGKAKDKYIDSRMERCAVIRIDPVHISGKHTRAA